jgi:hypothetical protein
VTAPGATAGSEGASEEGRNVVFLFAGAAATSVLFTVDAFFAFAGWRVMNGKPGYARASLQHLHAFTERREPFLAAIAMASTLALGLEAGTHRPRVACLLGGALIALVAHLLLHMKTACLVRTFSMAPVDSVERQSRGARLEAAMVTRASLQAAAFICIVAAGLLV